MAVTIPRLDFSLPKGVPSYNLASGLGLGLNALSESYDVAQKQRLAEAQLKRLLEKDLEDSALKRVQAEQSLQDILSKIQKRKDEAQEAAAKTALQGAEQGTFAHLMGLLGPRDVTTQTPTEPGTAAPTTPDTTTEAGMPFPQALSRTVKERGGQFALDKTTQNEFIKRLLTGEAPLDVTKLLAHPGTFTVAPGGTAAKGLANLGISLTSKPDLTDIGQALKITGAIDPKNPTPEEITKARAWLKSEVVNTAGERTTAERTAGLPFVAPEASARTTATQAAELPFVGPRATAGTTATQAAELPFIGPRAAAGEAARLPFAGAKAAAEKAGGEMPETKIADRLLGQIEKGVASKDVSLGKITGTVAPWLNMLKSKGYAPIPLSGNLTEDERTLIADINDYADSVLRLRSGKQINEREYARIEAFVPNTGDTPATFLAKLTRERRNIGIRLEEFGGAMRGGVRRYNPATGKAE